MTNMITAYAAATLAALLWAGGTAIALLLDPDCAKRPKTTIGIGAALAIGSFVGVLTLLGTP